MIESTETVIFALFATNQKKSPFIGRKQGQNRPEN